MNILWIPQISSKNLSNVVLLNKDSNMAVLRNLIGTKFFKENTIYLAFEYSLSNCVIDEEITKNFKIFANESRVFQDAYLERFCFDASFFKKIKEKVKIDVVFVNEPTKVIPLKRIFTEAKIVTYNHWMAFKNMPEISLRQYEGMAASDLCFVNSYYAAFELCKHYSQKYLLDVDNDLMLQKAQPAFRGIVKPLKTKAKKAFVYNHRLSSDKYYSKAYSSLLRICDMVEKVVGVDNMPIIYFTNPSGKLFELDRPYFKLLNLATQKEYTDFLESKEVFGHLNTFFESEGMWSMSTVDCARAGNVCILPKKYGYAEIFNSSYEGYCRDEEEAAKKIISLLTIGIDRKGYSNYFIESHSAENVGEKMNNCLKALLKMEALLK